MAKANYRILLCGGALGIGNCYTFSCMFLQRIMWLLSLLIRLSNFNSSGKTRYRIELFNYLSTEWKLLKCKRLYMLYMILDFSNSDALINEDYKILRDINSLEIIFGLRLAYQYCIDGKYMIDFAQKPCHISIFSR